MKLLNKYAIAALVLCSFTLSAQRGLTQLISTQGDMNSKVRNQGRDDFDGSIYLYKNWDQPIIVKTVTDIFKVKGGNFNVQSGNVELSINKDSTFVVSPQNTDYVRIGSDFFKYNPLKDGKVYQVVYESPKISLYKKYFIVVSNGSYNPLTGKTTPNTYKSRFKYVLNLNGVINDNFKPKKKTILKLFPQFKNEINSYTKKQKLSYKKPNDIRSILSYAISLEKK